MVDRAKAASKNCEILRVCINIIRNKHTMYTNQQSKQSTHRRELTEAEEAKLQTRQRDEDERQRQLERDHNPSALNDYAREQVSKLRDQTHNYLTDNFTQLKMTHAVTLTFDRKKLQPYLDACDDKLRTQVMHKVLRDCYHQFLKHLNTYCLNTAYKKHGKRVPAFGLIDGLAANSTPHYHCAMQKPAFLTDKKFTQIIAKSWKQVSFAGYQLDVTKISTAKGWAGYLSSKVDSVSKLTIDWDNIQ